MTTPTITPRPANPSNTSSTTHQNHHTHATRLHALSTLQSHTSLTLASLARNESLAQTQRHYELILYNLPPDFGRREVPAQASPGARKIARGKAKGKVRVEGGVASAVGLGGGPSGAGSLGAGGVGDGRSGRKIKDAVYGDVLPERFRLKVGSRGATRGEGNQVKGKGKARVRFGEAADERAGNTATDAGGSSGEQHADMAVKQEDEDDQRLLQDLDTTADTGADDVEMTAPLQSPDHEEGGVALPPTTPGRTRAPTSNAASGSAGKKRRK